MIMNTYHEATDNITPFDILIKNESLDIDEDDRLVFLTFLTETLHFVLDQDTDNKDAVIYGILYALKDFTTLEMSTRNRAKLLQVSSGFISYYTSKYKAKLGI
jgi:hypothetical protein